MERTILGAQILFNIEGRTVGVNLDMLSTAVVMKAIGVQFSEDLSQVGTYKDDILKQTLETNQIFVPPDGSSVVEIVCMPPAVNGGGLPS